MYAGAFIERATFNDAADWRLERAFAKRDPAIDATFAVDGLAFHKPRAKEGRAGDGQGGDGC